MSLIGGGGHADCCDVNILAFELRFADGTAIM
jgi:hypothetical protein